MLEQNTRRSGGVRSMAELILVIKLFLLFVAILIICGIAILLVLVFHAVKFFIEEKKKEKENGNKEI